MKIPSNRVWTQTNNGDYGVLAETHNINLDKGGLVSLNRRSVAHMASSVDADLGRTLAITQKGVATYAITNDEPFTGDITGGRFSEIASSAQLSGQSDAAVLNNKLWVVDTTTVDVYSGSTWTTDVITGLDSFAPHPLCVFDSLPTYKMAIGDANVVRTYSTAYAANSTVLTLPDVYNVTGLVYRNGYLYVAAKHTDGGEAIVFMWDGNTANANYAIPVGGSWIFSIVAYKDSVVGITDEGELFAISGTSKVTLGNLPIYLEQGRRWYAGGTTPNGPMVHRGLAVQGDVIYLSVTGTGTVTSTQGDNAFIEGMQDGLWCYDPKYGLYHYASPSSDIVVADTSVTRSGNQITTSANHGLVTGDEIQFATIGNLTGVVANQVYFAIVIDADTIEIAGNRYDADNGNEITLGGTPNSSDKLLYVPNTSQGTIIGGGLLSGAVVPVSHRIVAENTFRSDVLYGFGAVTNANASVQTLQGFHSSWNVGWFTLQKIYAAKTRTWNNAYVHVNKALMSNEKIVIKYRYEERLGMPSEIVTGTWTNTTAFTTTDQRIQSNVQVGDEIVCTKGQGQGRTAHITAITVTNGTATITVDEAIGSATNTAFSFYATNFKKAIEVTGTRERKGIIKAALNAVKSPWIQIKIEMRGFDISIPSIDISSTADTA